MLTGPLPEQVNHRKLAADKVRLDGSIPVAAFERLSGLLEHTRGDIEARLQFRKGTKQKSLVVGAASGTVALICQRCLSPVEVRVQANIKTLLVDGLEELLSLAQSDDGMVCAEDEVVLVDLLEDELILSLPMAPRHEPGPECEASVASQGEFREDQDVPVDTYQPFADLAALTQTQNKQRK
ncbi:MAG: YceD family protein [Pseudomonadales bacterium]